MVRPPAMTKAAIIKSVLFHAAIVGVFVVSTPFLSRDIAPEQPILTVDIVSDVPQTNLDEGAKAASKQDQAPKTSSDDASPPPPPPPPPPKPTPSIAEPVPSESVASKKAEAPSPPRVVTAPPKRPVKQSPEFKKRQQEQVQLTKKLQDLAERKARQQREKDEDAQKKKAADADTADAEKKDVEDKIAGLIGQALNTPAKTSVPLGVSDIDRLRNHIAVCWSPPAGASGADALIVDIIVRLNSVAEVQEVDIVDQARMRNDGVFSAAARAASSAVIECSPLPLPLDQYDKWKVLEFEFNPSFITRN